MANRLTKEKSPYLLQHKENPVDWYPWGKEAFHKAKWEDKPVFLSIGYCTENASLILTRLLSKNIMYVTGLMLSFKEEKI